MAKFVRTVSQIYRKLCVYDLMVRECMCDVDDWYKRCGVRQPVQRSKVTDYQNK